MSKEENTSNLEIEVAADKVRLKADVPQSVMNRGGHALLDLIKPFTSSAGFVGDQIEKLRSDESLYVAFDRAKKIKEERGEVIKPIHRKNLVALLEHISCEDPDSELMETWAYLLAGAGEGFDEFLRGYTEILAKLGPKSVALLDFFFVATTRSEPDWGVLNHLEENRRILDTIFPHENFFDYNTNNATQKAIDILHTHLQGPFLAQVAEIPIVHPVEIARGEPSAMSKSTVIIVNPDFPNEKGHWDILEQYGLVGFHELVYRTSTSDGGSRFRGRVTLYELTRMGADFVKRCKGIV